jgi:putative ABC transport system permease protein
MGVLARVRGNATIKQALAELSTESRRVDAETYHHDFRFAPVGVQERLVRSVRPALIALMAAVGVLVLIMSANLATLALGRAARREREFAVRQALGAARTRIARQVFTETVALSLGGALGGMLFARWGVRGLLSLAPAGLPRRDEVGIDFVVVGFTLALGLLIGLGIGLAPVIQSARRDLTRALRERASSLPGHQRTRGALVLLQVALSLVLLAGSGVLLGGFVRLMTIDPGFSSKGVAGVTLRLNPARYKTDRISAFARDGLARLERLPGVRAVGATSAPPLSTDADQYTASFPESPANTGDRQHDIMLVDLAVATPGYFSSLGVPLLDGRDFGPQDDARAPKVAIIDHLLARHYFPGTSPIGKRIRIDDDTLTIAGVVQQVRLYTMQADGRPQVYLPDDQFPSRSLTFFAKGPPGREASLVIAARAAIAAIDPAQPIIDAEPLARVVSQSLGERRLVLLLVGGFAVTALLLAALGVYGVTSTAVAQRTRELGIRVALGANGGDVVRLVLVRPMLLVGCGVGLGALGTFAVAKVARRVLYEASPAEPLTLGLVALLLAVVALLSSYFPARRAARVEPATVLRSEN